MENLYITILSLIVFGVGLFLTIDHVVNFKKEAVLHVSDYKDSGSITTFYSYVLATVISMGVFISSIL